MPQPLRPTQSKEWSLIIRSKTPWFDLHLEDLWRYRDLLLLFVKRDFIAVYKQTVLGPLWFVLQPLLTTFIFILIFERAAGIPTDGVPPILFYLSGLVIWNYFSACLTNTANTFTANTDIFGKVYFPRLIVPLSSVLSALIRFGIQWGILLVFMGYYTVFRGSNIPFTFLLLLIPFLLLLIAALGLGLGIIVSSLTTKYRDLGFLVTFGVQLLLYATPVIYPLSFLRGMAKSVVQANPLTPIVEMFRYALLGVGEFSLGSILYSASFTGVILFIGILLFNKVEKNFMDVV